MRRRLAAAPALIALIIPSGAVAAAPEPLPTYTNPVSASFGRNFADPSVIRGRDGYWYGYATNGRRTADDERHLMMIAYDGVATYGHAAIGPAADTLWLRLRHRVDPANGEHEYRAAISVDGTHWTWYGVRTLPAGPQPAIGLVAMDRDDDPTGTTNNLTATFDYLRILR